MIVRLVLNRSINFQDNVDEDGDIIVKIDDHSDNNICFFYLNAEQASEIISHLRKVFEL